MATAFYKRREMDMDEKMMILAWQTSHIMNSSGNYKKAIKPSDIYKSINEQDEANGGTSELKPVDREVKNAELAKLQEKFNK